MKTNAQLSQDYHTPWNDGGVTAGMVLCERGYGPVYNSGYEGQRVVRPKGEWIYFI